MTLKTRNHQPTRLVFSYGLSWQAWVTTNDAFIEASWHGWGDLDMVKINQRKTCSKWNPKHSKKSDSDWISRLAIVDTGFWINVRYYNIAQRKYESILSYLGLEAHLPNRLAFWDGLPSWVWVVLQIKGTLCRLNKD